jgi:inhibitor of KinA
MTLANGFPRFQPVADHGVLVEFGDRISDDIHAAVLHLDGILAIHPFEGFLEAVPAFASILVRFDCMVTDHAEVIEAVSNLLSRTSAEPLPPAHHEVLVCYDEEFGPDLAGVSERTGLSREAVIEAHLAGDYSVFMYGFAPGYAYLGGVPDRIRLPRKPSPVRGIAAGSVIIASGQCLVTTLIMPTGWWIIGRSPTKILLDGQDGRPFLFDVRDKVKFRRIDRATHDKLSGKGD